MSQLAYARMRDGSISSAYNALVSASMACSTEPVTAN